VEEYIKKENKKGGGVNLEFAKKKDIEKRKPSEDNGQGVGQDWRDVIKEWQPSMSSSPREKKRDIGGKEGVRK